MNRRATLFIVALVFAAAGVFLGMGDVNSGDANCGSAFSPSRNAEFNTALDSVTGDNNTAPCEAAISERKPFAYGALALAGIALIAGLMTDTARPGTRLTQEQFDQQLADYEAGRRDTLPGE